MKKIICLFLLFIFQQKIVAQNPLNVVITGECSYGGGVYTYIGLLNGKNNYSYTFTLDNAPATSVLGFHNNKWIIYAAGVIDNVGFQNTNVPFGTLSKKTEIPKDQSIELVNKICPPSAKRVSIVDLIMGDSIVIDFGDRKLRYGRIASLRNPYSLELQNLDSDSFLYTLTPEDYANALP